MSKRDEHIVNSLRRWIQGDIDQKEENRLDRQAREDTFLGEALEGYRQFPGSKHQERLERMREQLQANTQERKKNSKVWIALPYRIASAAAVVLAVGLFWWLNPTQQAELAKADQMEQLENTAMDRESAPPVEESASVTESGETYSAPSRVAPEPEVDPTSNSTVPAQAFADSQTVNEELERTENLPVPAKESAPEKKLAEKPTNRPQDSVLNQENTPQTYTRARTQTNEDVPLATQAAPRPAPPASANDFTIGGVKLEAPQGTRLVTGQVLDRAGSPLNGVLVVTPGDRTGTITNINGQYEILLDSNVQKLEFQRSGYSSQRIDIPESQNVVRVTLDEHATTVDQMIASKESSRKNNSEKVEPAVSASSLNLNIAEPEISFRRFERRLQRTLNYPQAAIDNNISGSVTLRFIILPDGRIVDVKAIAGPSELYEEAVRLIKDGPNWKITNGGEKSITFTYRLDFSLK